MSLCHCPLVYAFLETADLESQRATMETDIGLSVLGARHGVVTYDAGTMLFSFDLSPRELFERAGADALATVFAVARDQRTGPDLVTDGHGHHYVFEPTAQAGRSPWVTELRLATEDLTASVDFYRTVLGLVPFATDANHARFEVGAVTLVLEGFPRPALEDRARRDTYMLGFYTPAIQHTRAALSDQGLAFSGGEVDSREFGSIIPFEDPSGHRFCLYEPSVEALNTNSGRKLRQILAGCDCMVTSRLT